MLPIRKINNHPIGVAHTHLNEAVLADIQEAFTTSHKQHVELLEGVFINVKHPSFGAVGDGVVDKINNTASGTDDTLAIQAAIDYAESIGGGVVFFPKGTYLVTDTIRVKSENIHLMGVTQSVHWSQYDYNPLLTGSIAEIIWVGVDSVLDPVARAVDKTKVVMLVGPDYGIKDYSYQFTGGSYAIRNTDRQQWATGVHNYVLDHCHVDDPSDLTHHGQVYQCIKVGGITKAENKTYYPPWEHPEAWALVSGEPKPLWPSSITGFKVTGLRISAGAGPTGAWENRLCTNNAARALHVLNCGHYELENVFLDNATEVAYQVGGYQNFHTTDWDTRYCTHNRIWINQQFSVGMACRIGEYLSTIEQSQGMSCGHWKCHWNDIEMWWGFFEHANTSEWVFDFIQPIMDMMEAEALAGRVLADNNPLCGMHITQCDHVEWDNININQSLAGGYPSLLISGYPEDAYRNGGWYGLDCLTFRKYSGTVKMLGAGDTLTTRGGEVFNYITHPAGRLHRVMFWDYNAGNGGSNFPDRSPGSVGVGVETSAGPGIYGLRLHGSMHACNSSIVGMEQRVGCRYQGTAHLARHDHAQHDWLHFTSGTMASESLPNAGSGLEGAQFDLVDTTAPVNDGTYTITSGGLFRDSWLFIEENWTQYSTNQATKGFHGEFINPHTVTVTMHPIMNWNNWNHGCMILEPWMDTNHPLTFIGENDTFNSPNKMDSYAGTLIIKMNSTGDGVWPGWDLDTLTKIIWIQGSAPVLDSLAAGEGIVISVLYSHAVGKYLCQYTQILEL